MGDFVIRYRDSASGERVQRRISLDFRNFGRAQSEKWDDTKFFENLKKYEFPKIKATPKDITLGWLRFLLAGKNPYNAETDDFVLLTLMSFMWTENGRTREVFNHPLINRSETEPAQNVPAFEEWKSDLISRAKAESTSQERVPLRDLETGREVADDELQKLAMKYHDLVLLYYARPKSTPTDNATFANIKTQMGYVSHKYEKWMTKANAISLYNSLYLLLLIMLRCKGKDPQSVLDFICDGGYINLMRTLAEDDHTVIFSLDPCTPEFISYSKYLSGAFHSNLLKAYYALILIFCINQDGLRQEVLCLSKAEALALAKNPPKDPTATLPQNCVNFLRAGCMLQLRYTGVAILRFVEELARKTELDWAKLINTIGGIVPTTHMNRVLYKKILEQMRSHDKCVKEEGSQWKYHPFQHTWRYCKLLNSNALLDFQATENVQVLWRLASLVEASGEKINVKNIRALRNYIVDRNDLQYIAVVSKALFASSK